VVFAALCVLLAAVGHAHSTAAPLPWWAPAAALLVTGCAAWFLTGRERGVPLVMGATVVTQSGLHLVFSLTTAAAGPMGERAAAAPAMDPAEHAGMAAHGMHAAHAAHVVPDARMAAVHLAAALLSGLWLAYGERAAFRIAWALGAWLVAPLRLLRRPPQPVRPPAAPVTGPPQRRRRRGPALNTVTTRGPPRGIAVA
jgi:hypothetical protein